MSLKVALTSNNLIEAVKCSVAPSALEDDTRPPTNLYSVESPHKAAILSVVKIIPTVETYHVVFVHDGYLPHWEGQAFGVMLAPENPSDKPDQEMLRYFFAASSRYGDYFNGRTASLCVSPIPGTTSEILCKSKRGDKILLTGPTGEEMLLGDYKANKTHIFVATTGAGIAPFKAHLRRFFKEDIPTFKFSGLAWLLDDSGLYKDEFEQYRRDCPENFLYQMTTLTSNQARDMLQLLIGGAYICFAGGTDKIATIEKALEQAANVIEEDWAKILAKLKIDEQWRVQVY
ncbi:ferredoxin--NADP reductase, root isozyme, chloroplastic-like [Humulus lupulus]|uniref:ferredoxin--NADP reductase, root isozyme, chloroplastic-like n=1 Tax=Humulus lupulus TaxID=3486 RepID=UPI002B4160DD|nr:ferredoxin--NADP reductase, root isozyme, chloroplastic-like [Humulus lupulus]